jgi:diguanylate cyclase (GGDEF)-like protein
MRILKDKSLLKTVIVSFTLLVFFELIIVVSNSFILQTEEAELYKKSYSIQAEIEKVFLNIFTISDAYSSYAAGTPAVSKEETEVFLQHLLSHEENYVRNIAFIEDTTIKFNYPYEENMDSIGVDLAQIPGQSEGILYVKNTLNTLFVGPVELVQGGSAFILLTPIVIEEEYYGHISTVMDAEEFNSLLKAEAEKYNVELKIGYPDQESFINVGNEFEDVSVKTTITSNNMVLELNVYDLSSSNAGVLLNYGVRLISLLIILMIGYYVYKNGKLINEVLYKATHDSLTNIYNRAKFTEDFVEGNVAGKLIAYLDINKFKTLNDTLGHHFGDWGLIQIATEFSSIGKFEAYRNSGDEFFLVSKEPMTEEQFLSYTTSFNSSFYNEELKQNIDILLSVGVIEKVDKDLEFEKMLMYLDYAMYDAKKQKQTYTLVDESLMEKYNQQKQMEQLLIKDIKSNKFLTYYQPIIDAKNRRIDSIEVLSRWKYNNELLSAGKFIDIVKKIKYIEKVDQNLFNNLQEQYKVMSESCKHIGKINFAVNLSAEILKEFELDYSKFDMYIKNIRIPINRIVFEISEDINLGLISDETLEYIKSKGFNIVIDDFGSGVSKLSDVLSGKLHAIKMDKAMLPTDTKDVNRLKGFKTIVKAINSTGSLVCAEGVETKEQLLLAKNAGCNILQGYLFSKPMSLEEVITYIKTFDYSNYEM